MDHNAPFTSLVDLSAFEPMTDSDSEEPFEFDLTNLPRNSVDSAVSFSEDGSSMRANGQS
jgi:hypothetical protein